MLNPARGLWYSTYAARRVGMFRVVWVVYVFAGWFAHGGKDVETQSVWKFMGEGEETSPQSRKTRRHFGLEGTSFDDQQTIRYNEAIVTTNAESISATAESLETTSFDDLQTICNNGATVTANARVNLRWSGESLDVVRTLLIKPGIPASYIKLVSSYVIHICLCHLSFQFI